MKEETLMDRPMRVGIIGAGGIVERVHLPVLRQLPGVQVAGLLDPDSCRARDIALRHGIPRVCQSQEEFAGLGLDAALIACPNHLHAAMSIFALKAGMHVLCEKPMAIGVVEAEAMAATARGVNRTLMIAFANRFRPEVIALHRAIRDGQLGTITAIRCGWLRHRGVPGTGSWFTNRDRAGGGVLMDLGSHLIDLALWLAKKHRVLSAISCLDYRLDTEGQAAWYAPSGMETGLPCTVEITANGFVILEGPLSLFIEVSWNCPVPYDRTYLHVTGTRGIAQLETLFGLSPLGYRPEHPLRIWIDGLLSNDDVTGARDLLDPYRQEWEVFIGALRKGLSLSTWLLDNVATIRVIEALYQVVAPQVSAASIGSGPAREMIRTKPNEHPVSAQKPAIMITQLCKTFGNNKKRVLAVDHLSLVVQQGEVFGLLGPNGSGKTTTINMLSGLTVPTSGNIDILGYDIRRNIRQIRQRLGTIPQETALYEELTAWANMDFHADLFGVPRREKQERITRMLELVGLLDRKDAPVKTFSGGMKRRLALARALLHDPQLIYLDEPTLGVDVQSRRAIWDYILSLRDQGKTVLMTTNYLEEAQALCDRLAILDRGKLIAVDTPDHLTQTYGGSVIEVQTVKPIQTIDGLRALPGITEVDQQDCVLRVRTRGTSTPLAVVVNSISQDGEIKDIAILTASLDEVFLQLTGAALRD